MTDINIYAQTIRRKLHKNPEVGFELPKTLSIIANELEDIGVEYTDKYGKSSLVATINPYKKGFTIGIRADIDALPLKEENDVPYKSKTNGFMHACGHDAHTAILIATIKELNDIKDKINCQVKFIFEAAEETGGGAKLMVEDGVMDDIDCIIGLHCDPAFEAGTIAVSPNEQSANSDGFYLDFYGESTHAAEQYASVDAIMMAIKAYSSIEFMIAKEIDPLTPCIFNVGMIEGGKTNNIVADHCRMFCTLRTYSANERDKALSRIKKIIDYIAKESGGRAEYTTVKTYSATINDPVISEKLRLSAQKVVGEECVYVNGKSMIGEDFSDFANVKPGCLFRLGTKNEEKGITAALHQTTFDIDEEALGIAVDVYKQFVIDNMNGI